MKASDSNKEQEKSKEKKNVVKRLKGAVICRPIVLGSIAFFLGRMAVDEHSHKWTIYLRGLEGEDLSYFIQKVVFTLHPSCSQPVVTVETPPYQVTQTGWGEFQAMIRIYFNDPSERPIDMFHMLRLYPIGGQTSNAALLKKPVVHESYDELVFQEPTEKFYELLLNPPEALKSEKEDELKPYYTNFSEVESMGKIIAAQNFVTSEIEKTLLELNQIEKDINHEQVKKPKRSKPQLNQVKRAKTESSQKSSVGKSNQSESRVSSAGMKKK